MTVRVIPLLATILAAVSIPAPRLDAQDLDVDAWIGLAQMPVAVARLEVAGVPSKELGMLIPALNTRDVSPSRFLETVWGIPVLWGDDANAYAGTGSEEGVGSYVQAMHARGLRGRELADAIHDELNRRGVPAGGRSGERRRDALDPDYLPDEWVDGRFRDDPLFRPGADASDRPRGKGRIFREVERPDRRPADSPAVLRRGGPDRGGAGPDGPPRSPPGLEEKEPGKRGPPKAGGKAGPGPERGSGKPGGGPRGGGLEGGMT